MATLGNLPVDAIEQQNICPIITNGNGKGNCATNGANDLKDIITGNVIAGIIIILILWYILNEFNQLKLINIFGSKGKW